MGVGEKGGEKIPRCQAFEHVGVSSIRVFLIFMMFPIKAQSVAMTKIATRVRTILTAVGIPIVRWMIPAGGMK